DDSIKQFSNAVAGTGFNYAEDAVGRITQDECSNFNYDGFDRLWSATGASRAACTQPWTDAVSYGYDGLDRQVSRQSRALGATSLHYDGLSAWVAVEYGPNGATTPNTSTYELDPDGRPKALQAQPPPTHQTVIQYLAGDGQGNVATVTDTSANPAC